MARKGSERYLRMYAPVLEVLKELGGSGTPKEVIPAVLDQFQFSDAELEETTKSGANRVENEVRWASAYLKELELLATDTPGVWTLTEAGREVQMTIELARQMRSEWHSKRYREAKAAEIAEEDEDVVSTESFTEGMPLIEVIRGLSPRGFENLCKLLLRASGFQEVFVTGKSGDGGIDGHGILQMSSLVSQRVLFQCKRYQGSVSSDKVRDFRGAMMGRSELGIILTTGYFTRDAEKEASRDGAPPVELVNGDRLVQLMEEKGLGVKPRMVYDVDYRWFDQFQEV